MKQLSRLQKKLLISQPIDTPIFFGSGDLADIQVKRLHNLIDVICSIRSGLQQGGLQGSEPDSEKFVLSQEGKIQDMFREITVALRFL